jgi:hypothetical protein
VAAEWRQKPCATFGRLTVVETKPGQRHMFSYEVPVTIMNWFHLLEVTCECLNLGNIVFPTCLARCNLFF